MEQQCQYLAHGTWPCERKKRKIKNIGQDIYLFSLKLAFDMMIFYCRLGEGRDKGSSFEFIFKFSPFFFCIISSFPVLKKSSHFCDLRVVLFIKRFIFRIRVSGVRVSVMVWLIVANVRGDRCRAALRIRRLFHRFCKVQLHLEVWGEVAISFIFVGLVQVVLGECQDEVVPVTVSVPVPLPVAFPFPSVVSGVVSGAVSALGTGRRALSHWLALEAVHVIPHCPVLFPPLFLLWSGDEEGVYPEVKHFVLLHHLILLMEELHLDVSTDGQRLREFKIHVLVLAPGVSRVRRVNLHFQLVHHKLGICKEGQRSHVGEGLRKRKKHEDEEKNRG